MSADPSIASFLHIRALKAVVEHGSFSGAAKELGYTTSAISQQISQLEKTLGVNLFERGPRSVAVTAAGEQMYGGFPDSRHHPALTSRQSFALQLELSKNYEHIFSLLHFILLCGLD